ncbi:MAG: high-affinity branched-chain amino acid ABC transporter permease LivM [Pikeienuella sp.]
MAAVASAPPMGGAGPLGAFDWRRALRNAAIVALLSAILALFFIGMTTDIRIDGLQVLFRWRALFYTALIAFFGRLLLESFIFQPAPKPIRALVAAAAVIALVAMMAAGAEASMLGQRALTGAVLGLAAVAILALVAHFRARGGGGLAAAAGRRPWIGRVATLGLLAVALTLPFLITSFFPAQQRQYIDLAILIMTYIMLGWGLNIVVGLAGLLDLGYVAFYAVGAYSFALLSTHFAYIGFWTALPMAGALAAMWGLILGFPVLRLRGDYLAIVTLAFGEIIRIVLLNWYEVTGGPNGISGIPKPTFFGIEFSRGEGGFADLMGIEYNTIQRFIYLYYIILLLALVTNFVTLRLRKLPIGRAWEALREDEIACRSLGINTTNTKLTAFSIGAMFGGFAGSFFATRQGFISPESFTFMESAIILAIVVLGGLGSQIGVVVASVVMIGAIEMLRNLDFLGNIFPGLDPVQYRMLIFGLAMVAIMVWKPRGLVTRRDPSAVLKERKQIGADLVAQGEGH